MFVVVSYDIPDDRRRDRVCQALKDFGTQVQYSVFEANLGFPEIQRLQERLRSLIDPQEDSVRFYFLCQGCVARIRIMGQGEVTRLSPIYWV